MTEPEFRFKIALAVSQYKAIYGYIPIEVVSTKDTVLMLDASNAISFASGYPKYMGMRISYKYIMNCKLAELGTDRDKLEF